MNPRKKESKKWTTLPPELTKQIKLVFEENFASQLEGKTLKVEGRIYPTEIMMRIGINTKGELRYQNFEVSVDHSQEKQDTIAKINLAVDAIASLIADFLNSGDEFEPPLIWHEYPFEKHKIWLQFTSVNSELEAQANNLLGVDNENSLMVETLDEMEALEIPEDEEIDTSKPKIFRVPTDNPNDKAKKKKKEDMH